MGKIAYQISCKNCGGYFPKIAGERIVSCPYCSRNSLVENENEYQRFYVEAVIDKHEALKKAREIFEFKNASKSLQSEALPLDSKLCFIPFYLISFFKTGHIEVENESILSQKDASWNWLLEKDDFPRFLNKIDEEPSETKTKVIY